MSAPGARVTQIGGAVLTDVSEMLSAAAGAMLQAEVAVDVDRRC
jgi:hypothetical protein